MDPPSTVRELLSGLTVGNPFSREGSQGSSGSEPVASVLVSSSLREGGRICLGLSFDPNLSWPLLESGGKGRVTEAESNITDLGFLARVCAALISVSSPRM